MKEERVVRTNDVISYTVTKSLKEVGRENFWWLFSLSLLWGCHCFLADVGKGVLVRESSEPRPEDLSKQSLNGHVFLPSSCLFLQVLATCLVIFQVKQTALYETFTLFRGTGIQVRKQEFD